MTWSLFAEYWLVVVLGALVLGQAGWWAYAKWRRKWRARRRSRIAVEGEVAAERVVQRMGYEIVDRQARTQWRVTVDGEPLDVDLRADLLLRRGGKSYVADVKTGDKAPRLTSAATRRQLLEYRCAYDVNGVLLIDMTKGRIRHVEFPLDPAQKTNWKQMVIVALTAFLLGGVAAGL